MRRGAMNPFLIGVPRSTDHLCRRRIPRCFWDQKSLEDRGWPSWCESHPFGGCDPWSAKPFSLERVMQMMRIQFALKAEILWKNPISCSGNPSEEGTPLQRILFVIEKGRPMMWMSVTSRREPPKVGEALSRRQSLALRRSRYSDTVLWGEGDCWGEGIHLMKPEEVHHIGRTLPTSETDSHRGLEPHVAEPNLGSCWWRGPCWC